MTRVYVASTLPDLAAVLGAGPAAGEIRATDPVVADDDSEEGEYAALMTAADASASLVTGLTDGVRRRVVVVADVPGPVGEDGEPVPVRWRDVVAVHVDAADDADPDDDLGWYATQELPHLLGP